eukprot:12887744-Prorocentrum_lima.AAC.1
MDDYASDVADEEMDKRKLPSKSPPEGGEGDVRPPKKGAPKAEGEEGAKDAEMIDSGEAAASSTTTPEAESNAKNPSKLG